MVRPTAQLPTALIVMAKSPIAGQVKTRLCPPLLPDQAAHLAAAALLDTFDAVDDCAAGGGVEPVLAWTGALSRAARGGEISTRLARWRVVRQRGRDLAERIAHAHADSVRGDSAATFQIGMDTPQVTGDLLTACVAALWRPGIDAVLGPAADGGWWGLGLRHGSAARLLIEVPMSTAATGLMTLQALRSGGLKVAVLPSLTDVDTIADARAVSQIIPESRFSTELESIPATSAQAHLAGAR